MLFADKLYQITALEKSDSGDISATLLLNAEHPIFAGHFPSQPVLPGVCTIQAVTDVLEQVLGYKVQLQSASNIKFTNIVDPVAHPQIQLRIKTNSLENGGIKIDAEAIRAGENCLKLKGIFS